MWLSSASSGINTVTWVFQSLWLTKILFLFVLILSIHSFSFCLFFENKLSLQMFDILMLGQTSGFDIYHLINEMELFKDS